MKEKKFVKIRTGGCDIYKHGHVYEVLEFKDGVYPTFNGRDRINAHWCKEISMEEAFDNQVPVFANATTNGISLNDFRRKGYYSDGSKTGAFEDSEYAEYEKYLSEHNLEFKP